MEFSHSNISFVRYCARNASRLKSLCRWQPFPWGPTDIWRLNRILHCSFSSTTLSWPVRKTFIWSLSKIKSWKTPSGPFWPTGAGPLLVFLQQNLRFQFRLSSHTAELVFFSHPVWFFFFCSQAKTADHRWQLVYCFDLCLTTLLNSAQ